MGRDGVVDEVIQVVTKTAPEIADGLPDRRSYVEGENPSDETQVAADVWANKVLKDKLTAIDGVGQFASEEEEAVTDCGDGLAVAIDPLDGSSNIPTNNLIGTIVGIYDGELPCSGENLVASFYVLYGPLKTVTIARDGQVDEYVIQEQGGEITLQQSNEGIRVSEKKIYGFGGNMDWFDDFRALEADISQQYKLRYGGSLVGDFNQVLHHGGVFGYPAKKGYENGKYRLLFEGNPMAYIVESAGGASSNGSKSVLAVEAEEVHQRVPFFAGHEEIVELVEEAVE